MTQSPSPSVDEVANGNAPLPFDRDQLGRFVREAWVRWAERQPNPKQSWLVQYDDLSEADKEADRQIGETVARWTIIGAAANASLVSPPKAGAGEQLKASCPGCNGTGNQGGNPLYGDCDDCGGTGSVTVSARVVDVPDIKLAIADYLQLRDESCGFDSTDEERAMSAAEIHDAVQTINAKLANHEARGDGVRVRPLEWDQNGKAVGCGVVYTVFEDASGTWRAIMRDGLHPVRSLGGWGQRSAALSSCQADLETRIRSALEAALPPLGDDATAGQMDAARRAANASSAAEASEIARSALLPPLGDGRAEIVEAAAKVAADWLNNWAADLYATFESYVEAQTTGKHNGRRIEAGNAKMYAGQFRERAEAVAGCADEVAAAIRSLSSPGGGLS